MNRNRTLLAALGGVAFLVAAVFVVNPQAAAGVPIEAVVGLLGNPYFLVAAFGAAALLPVVGVLAARAVYGIDQAVLPSPEEVHGVPRAGEEFDAFLEEVSLRSSLTDERHREVRERLYEAAVSAEMRGANLSREEAQARVDGGEWTDDDAVATFLVADATPTLGERLAAAARGDSAFQRAARRAADEVARAASADPTDRDGGRPAGGYGSDRADDRGARATDERGSRPAADGGGRR